MKTVYFLFVLITISFYTNAQKLVEGNSVRIIDNRNVTILPELLYFQPKHLGYMFVKLNEELFDITEEDIPLTFEVELGTLLTLYSVDFSAGMSSRYVNVVDDLSNFYPYFGIGYNLYR